MGRFLDQRVHMRQLRLVRALGEHGSLSAAARALRLTQPALTKSLHELERVFGEALFERSTRGVRPTRAGWVVVQFANQTLAHLDRLDDALSRLAAPGEGLVVLGALPVSAAGVLPGVVRALRRDHPALELRMEVGRTEELVPKLESGELDLVLGQLYPPEIPDGMVREALYDEPISVIARAEHPLFRRAEAGHREIAASDLIGCDLVLPTFGQRLGRDIEHLIEDLGLGASPRLLRSSSHLFIREMLHSSDMITIVPRLLMASDLVRGSLRIVPVIGQAEQRRAPPRPAGLILNPEHPLSPSATLLVAAVRETVGALTAGPMAITFGYGPFGGSDEKAEAETL